MAQLLLCEESHIYELDGIKIPSVSELCSPLGNDIEEFLETAIEVAGERGTILHKVLELMLIDDNSELEYPDEYEGYVRAIELFLAEHDIQPIAIEKPVSSSKMMIAGKPDLVCEFDRILSLLDYKFVAQVAKTKVKAQLNFYAEIYADNDIFIDNLIAVQFLPDGKYRLYPVKRDNVEVDLLLELHKLKSKKHPRGRIE